MTCEGEMKQRTDDNKLWHGSTQVSFVDTDMEEYNKCDSKVPRFNGTIEDDFYLWWLKVEAALERRKLATTLCDEEAEARVDKKAREIIIAALGNNPFREIQNYPTTKLA